jgi:hypothetical protein
MGRRSKIGLRRDGYDHADEQRDGGGVFHFLRQSARADTAGHTKPPDIPM